MTDAPWITMTDWSGLPDVYVIKAECQQGMFWRIEACSVPMAIGPEVRLVRADIHAAALDRIAELEAAVKSADNYIDKGLYEMARNITRAVLTPTPTGQEVA